MNVKKEIIENQRKLVTQLALFEQTIAELYQEYAAAFKNDRTFWENIATEEWAHEAYMRRMLSFLDKGNLFFNLQALDGKKLESLIEEIVAERDRAKEARGTIDSKHAFETALSIESSIVDGVFFQYAECDSPEFRIISCHLHTESLRHVTRIRERYLAECEARTGQIGL